LKEEMLRRDMTREAIIWTIMTIEIHSFRFPPR
jgi:hypothetical protein